MEIQSASTTGNSDADNSISGTELVKQDIISNSEITKICKHFCEKKRRRCKFSALKNCDYCVQHLAFNDQTGNPEKRIVCPLDPKHSVYEKNFEKHLKKCNAKIKTLGDYDIKNINVKDENDDQEDEKNNNPVGEEQQQSLIDSLKFNDEEKAEWKTYKDLTVDQLIRIVNLVIEFDKKLHLYDLEFNKLEDEYLESELAKRNDTHQKHMKQISSIVGHVDTLRENNEQYESTCLVELGAGRGKLSYWAEKARTFKLLKNEKKNNNDDEIRKTNLNILLIERGAQRYKFDTQMRVDAEENQSEFERIRIDLKDLYLNKVPLIQKSAKYVLYGKHLCGVATDYALRCLRISLENMDNDLNDEFKFGGFVLAVCCHHQCEWDAFCGQKLFKRLNIDANTFYILRSLTSWLTCGEREHKAATAASSEEIVPGYTRPKIGRICKNLFDYARLSYLNENLKLPRNYKLKTKLFYYIEPDVTLENTLIYISYDE